nr:unnamed protein product [Spirometra erinaceieuropaei]
MLVELSRYRVRSKRFPVGGLLHGLDGFVERERELEVGVDLLLRQRDDSGVGDVGGTVEDASEVLSPWLKNLCLLSEYGAAVGADERFSTLG